MNNAPESPINETQLKAAQALGFQEKTQPEPTVAQERRVKTTSSDLNRNQGDTMSDNPNQSIQIDALAAALAKAQGALKGAVKDSSNPFFKSTYADLQSVWEACRKPLSENGLCVIQTTKYENEKIFIETTLAHSSGQWIRGLLPVVSMKQDPQGIGSGISYARRYALAAMIGVYQVDDDAEKAMHRPMNTQKPNGMNLR